MSEENKEVVVKFSGALIFYARKFGIIGLEEMLKAGRKKKKRRPPLHRCQQGKIRR